MHLRPYQERILSELRAVLATHRSVLLCLSTGGGKTVLGAHITSGALARGNDIWFAVHRDFLISQTVATFDALGIPCSVIAPGRPFMPWERVQVASIPTIARRLDRLTPPRIMVLDECHHAASKSWARVIEWAMAGGSKIIGLSATPQRLDGRGLDTWFGHMVLGPPVRELMDAGYLSRYRAFAPSRPDVSGARTIAGDYRTSDLDEIMDQGAIIGDMVGHYRRIAHAKDGRPLRAIYFAVSVRHSEHIAASFNRAGVAARHLDASSTGGERADAARSLADGRLAVLSNVDLFGEGYDLAAQAGATVPVEAVGLARPTQSLTLHLQQIGRALRPKLGSAHAIILDHAGNLARHGLPDTPREWSLKGRDKASRKTDSGPPIRICPECLAAHDPSPTCPECGYVYTVEGREPDEVDGQLAEVDIEAAERARHAEFVAKKIEERECKTLADWEALGRRRGYAGWYGWARHRFKAMKPRSRGYDFQNGRQM